MPADLPKLVSAYGEYQRLSAGSRPQRLAADDLFWAVEHVAAAVEGDPAAALDLLDALLEHPGADPVSVGAGPLEDLLASGADGVDFLVAARCRTSEHWRPALGAVYLDRAEQARLPALSPHLPEPRP